MPSKKPTVQLELPDGNFLVSVHASANRAIVWRFEGNGIASGSNGVRLRRPSLDGIFRDLHIAWERAEGIADSEHLVAFDEDQTQAVVVEPAQRPTQAPSSPSVQQVHVTVQRDWISRTASIGCAVILLILAGACVIGMVAGK